MSVLLVYPITRALALPSTRIDNAISPRPRMIYRYTHPCRLRQEMNVEYNNPHVDAPLSFLLVRTCEIRVIEENVRKRPLPKRQPSPCGFSRNSSTPLRFRIDGKIREFCFLLQFFVKEKRGNGVFFWIEGEKIGVYGVFFVMHSI